MIRLIPNKLSTIRMRSVVHKSIHMVSVDHRQIIHHIFLYPRLQAQGLQLLGALFFSFSPSSSPSSPIATFFFLSLPSICMINGLGTFMGSGEIKIEYEGRNASLIAQIRCWFALLDLLKKKVVGSRNKGGYVMVSPYYEFHGGWNLG